MKRLIKLLNPIVYPLAVLYWKIIQPETAGVKVFIKYRDKVLFIKNTYGKGYWTLPGGGIKKREAPEDTAKREVKEEVGIELATVEYKGSFLYKGEGKKDTIHVFLAKVDSDAVSIDNREVDTFSWEKISMLTLTQSPVAKKCFELVGFPIE